MDRCQSGLIKRTIYKFHRNAFNKEALTEWPHLETTSSPFQAWPAPSLSAIRGGPRQASDGSGGMCGVCWKKWGGGLGLVGDTASSRPGCEDQRPQSFLRQPTSLDPVQFRLPSLPMVKGTWDLCVTWHPSQSPNWGSRAPSLPPLITKSPNSRPYPGVRRLGTWVPGCGLRLWTVVFYDPTAGYRHTGGGQGAQGWECRPTPWEWLEGQARGPSRLQDR